MLMNICPACGYDPDPRELLPSDTELKVQQLKNTFSKNLQNGWWLKQPEMVCEWLKSRLTPAGILDAGCGDGRWLPAILKTWGAINYIGIDRIGEHQEINRENFPDHNWITGNIQTLQDSSLSRMRALFDTVFMMGVFNPIMKNQDEFLQIIKKINPASMVVLFDLKQTGTFPHAQLQPEYKLRQQLEIGPDFQAPNQKDVVWLYERA